MDASKEELPLDLHQSPKSSAAIGSPKSSDSLSSKSRRKRMPKKISTSADEQAPELNQANVNEKDNNNKQTDSDECETIDKIAKMVSNITSNNSSFNSTNENENQQKVLKDVENRLEELFADAPQSEGKLPEVAPPTEQTASEQPEKPKPTKPKAMRKKKSDGNGNKKQKKSLNNTLNKNDKAEKLGTKMKVDEKSKTTEHKKIKTKDNGKSKVKGDVAPYLQIQKDGSFSIVNQTMNGDDDTEKSINKSKKPINTEKPKAIRGLHVSTLSNKYDADKRDMSWICVFCKLGPHKFKLGDLFGPYFLSRNSKEYQYCQEDPDNDVFRQSNRNKFAPITSPSSSPKKKRKTSEGTSRKLASPTSTVPDIYDGMTKVDEENYEIWLHEDCLAWAPGTYIIGTKIIGLEAAVWQSTRYRCMYCHKNGAMMCCLKKDCKKQAHFICARSKSWKLCDDFKTFCDQHAQLIN